MKIAVFGATGATGYFIAPLLVKAGHGVTVLARDRAKVDTLDGKVKVVQGNTRDAKAVADAIKDQDVVISALGAKSFKKDDLQEVFIKSTISAMKKNGVKRFIELSAFGVGDSAKYMPLFFKLLRQTLLKNIYDDKDKADAILIASDLDYTLVRPSRLSNDPAKGNVKTSADKMLSQTITREDVAVFLVSQIKDTKWIRKAVVIGY